MIEIKATDNQIWIGPLSGISSEEIAALYNSSAEMRYATGADFAFGVGDTKDAVVRPGGKYNEFVSGIYLSGADSDRNRFIGIITGTLMIKTIWIRQLAIHPGYRRQGLGARSAGLVLEYARDRYGSEKSYLSVVEENFAGCGFWSSLGFTRSKRINKVLFGDEKQYCIVIMQKKL